MSTLRRSAWMRWLPPMDRPSPSPVTTQTCSSGFEHLMPVAIVGARPWIVVEAVGVHVVREARRAADARDEHVSSPSGCPASGGSSGPRRGSRSRPQPGHQRTIWSDLKSLAVCAIVPAGQRVHLVLHSGHVILPLQHRVDALDLGDLEGLALDLVEPVAGTRYLARSTLRSWPMFSSGTRTCSKPGKISPRSGGSGFKWRRWIDETALPRASGSSARRR